MLGNLKRDSGWISHHMKRVFAPDVFDVHFEGQQNAQTHLSDSLSGQPIPETPPERPLEKLPHTPAEQLSYANLKSTQAKRFELQKRATITSWNKTKTSTPIISQQLAAVAENLIYPKQQQKTTSRFQKKKKIDLPFSLLLKVKNFFFFNLRINHEVKYRENYERSNKKLGYVIKTLITI